MRRRHRALISVALLLGCVGGFALLTSLSVGTEGPLAAGLARVGTGVGGIEHRLRERFVGPGRAAELRWFDRYRRDAALLRAPDSVLLGAYDSDLPQSLEGVASLERTLGVSLPIVQAYTAWGDRADEQFPLALASAIWDFGSIPLLTWEPWLTDFDNGRHPELPLREARERHGLTSIARGDYDFYVDEWAKQAAQFGKPIFVRFGHEMNDPYRYPWGPQNNTKEEFIAAWRHVVDRFRALHATNVVWVWSPHVAYQYWDLYYPGDTYVDWVATGVLNFGPIAQWSKWWTFTEIFGSKYQRLASFKKPVMIAEFGSLAVGGDRANWYEDALAALPAKYPAVRSVVFFHSASDQTLTYQKVDWRLVTDTAAARAVAAAINPWAPGPRLKQ
ncbi:MAG TPA: glycosyl hydrolase [Gemmatimonadaceae bacterium]|nr:glycosyl hydrolase [Gemmatimonadaceae bacterium]